MIKKMFSKKYKRKSGNIMDSDVGLFLGIYFSIEKNKKAKSCPTAQNKKFRHKKLPEAKLHNVVL